MAGISEPEVFGARTIQELVALMEKKDGLRIIGGGTATDELPKRCVPSRRVKELKSFEKWDRHFTFGPAMTLAEIEDIGRKNLPALLNDAVKTIGNRALRNAATLGGNIFSMMDDGHARTLFAPLLALDARFEFIRGSDIRNETRTVPILKLKEFAAEEMKWKWILSKIKIPNEDWELAIFRKLGPQREFGESSASFAFLADIQDRTLSTVRIAFAGKIILRSAEFENSLTGLPLPLDGNAVRSAVERGGKMFDEESRASGIENDEIARTQFTNLLRYSLEQLAQP